MRTETKDILKAWLAVSIAFAIASHGVSFGSDFLLTILISAVTVGIGFLAHELSHKWVAQKHGCLAEFRSFDSMLLLAILLSLFGFVFVAPGGVFIHGPGSQRYKGKIAAAGPFASLAIALVFFFLTLLLPGTHLSRISIYGFHINSWLALFNLLPFWMLDGQKVFVWNKKVYFGLLAFSVGFLVLGGLLLRAS
ncbi:MAG: M50 family metallopeptidase [Candidatus Woesearchaeota archaeon]